MSEVIMPKSRDYGFGGGVAGVIWDEGDTLVVTRVVLVGCCSGKNADPRLGFNWNATMGFGQ